MLVWVHVGVLIYENDEGVCYDKYDLQWKKCRTSERGQKMTKKELAMDCFSQGYNCTQSVVLAYKEYFDMDQDTLMRIAGSFGGGMGRLREVCGAMSGIAFVLGQLYGYSDPKAKAEKNDHYARIQLLAKQFEEKNGSIVCRELLGLNVKHDVPVAAERTAEYYKKRPCKEIVGIAAELLEKYIEDSGDVSFVARSVPLSQTCSEDISLSHNCNRIKTNIIRKSK